MRACSRVRACVHECGPRVCANRQRLPPRSSVDSVTSRQLSQWLQRAASDTSAEAVSVRPARLPARLPAQTAHASTASTPTGTLFSGAGIRTGAAVCATEIPDGAGARTFSARDRLDPDTDQDLVSKPPLQNEEVGRRAGTDDSGETGVGVSITGGVRNGDDAKLATHGARLKAGTRVLPETDGVPVR